jgi:hypothetical protein
MADNFDKDTVVLNRSNVHKQVDSVEDEKLLITELLLEGLNRHSALQEAR